MKHEDNSIYFCVKILSQFWLLSESGILKLWNSNCLMVPFEPHRIMVLKKNLLNISILVCFYIYYKNGLDTLHTIIILPRLCPMELLL